MGIRMVRQPSETPNVTNIDDIIPFRYAYGNQDGYVIGKGNEISHTIDGSTFRINSGRIVLQGVETDIDANGVSFTIDNASETRYFVVYYEVNLATQTTSIKLSNYDTAGYPNIELGDDLTANSSGIARLPLYRFTATSGVVSNVTKTAKAIEYITDWVINNFQTEEKTQFGEYVFSKMKLLTNNSFSWSQTSDGGVYKTLFTDTKSILGRKFYIKTTYYNGILDFTNVSSFELSQGINFNTNLKLIGWNDILFMADGNSIKVLPTSEAVYLESLTKPTTLTIAGTFYALYEIID